MRSFAWLMWMMVLTSCLGSEQPCEVRPDDPLCRLADAGPSADAAPADASSLDQ